MGLVGAVSPAHPAPLLLARERGAERRAVRHRTVIKRHCGSSTAAGHRGATLPPLGAARCATGGSDRGGIAAVALPQAID